MTKKNIQDWNIRPALAHQEGSFSDIDSHVGYTNLSRKEALDEQRSAMERGDRISDNVSSSDNLDYVDRYNTNLTTRDGQGFDHPTRHAPGN